MSGMWDIGPTGVLGTGLLVYGLDWSGCPCHKTRLIYVDSSGQTGKYLWYGMEWPL